MYKFSFDELSYGTKKYWEPAIADGIPCAMSKDRLLFMFHRRDVAIQLSQYPYKGRSWWFSESYDRAIAELIDDALVTVNPQFVYQNFKEVSYNE